ncbi:alpha/beta hydrolase [Streptomyces sp. SID5785]|uniref:RBBP9/YdeN family alpha/beta hydrolase n=1 Tax=Streptomyces sp. SID5785 TaxID=2690309 RepID=UPI001360FEB0|nr:alpha/beta hydrolase [Streptomyces sp. SID5785]MZD08548.1 alpha/beta hydrolase [Streptomyces sp. SID5785]
MNPASRTSTAATVVLVPGLRDHVADHWQTHLAARLPGSVTVPPLTAGRLSRAAQVAALDAVVAAAPGPVVLVAHSAGVHTTVHWAVTHDRPVRGALLATPPDFDSPLPDGHPDPATLREHGWLPVVRTRLPFPSIVASSSDDPLARRTGRIAALAADWGSRLVDLGPVGHLNPASGHGPWPQALRLLGELDGATFTRREAVQ